MFAGVKYDTDGYPYPTAAGRYCEWVHKTVDMSADMETFENFFETLRLECDKGEPAKLVWTVAEDTPDLVYYQVRFIKIQSTSYERKIDALAVIVSRIKNLIRTRTICLRSVTRTITWAGR